jgi:rod shape determining protein RodA
VIDDLTLGERLKRANWSLLLIPLGLTLVGIVTVGAASQGQQAEYAWLQVRWAIVGVAACLLMLAFPYRRIVEWRYVLYGVGILLLALVLVKGSGKSAGRWIALGSFRMQPSEFMKLIVVITLAGYIRYERRYRTFKGLAVPFTLTLVPAALIMKQPDLGTALLLVPVLFTLLYVAGARPIHLAVVGLAGLVAMGAMYVVPGLMNEYQKDRLHAYLHQSSSDKSLIQTQGHQLHESKTAIGTGTVFGSGTGEETWEATRFLPERHTDFAFAVLVTVFGFAGTTVFLVVYLAFLALLLRTAVRVREPSGRMLAVGAAAVFASQALINMAMTVGLLPIVGVTLPFVSYGGSSLLSSWIMLGLVLNAGADHPMEFGRGDFD